MSVLYRSHTEPIADQYHTNPALFNALFKTKVMNSSQPASRG